jgi:hemolysin activation/secretion protein
MFARARHVFAALAAVAVSTAVGAQVIPPSAQPGHERQRFIQPAPPLAQPGGPAISLPSTVAPAGAAKVKVIIRGVRVTGVTVYSPTELKSLYADLIGRPATLQTVYEIARRITERYGRDGYVLSRAIVPPQRLNPKGAIVHIQVIEGWINKIEWPSQLARYRDFFSDYAARITGERPVNIRTIERYLLLANDLPGLKFSTTLKPSNVPAASILVVQVTEKPLNASGRIDNRGTRSRGPFQFLASATANNTLGAHEAITLTYAGVAPLKELHFLYGGYKQVLTSEGLSAFGDASYSWGRPGTQQLELLEFSTRSTVVEGGLFYPLVRSRERNVTLAGLMFMSDNYSDILSAPFNADRLRGFRGKIDGDFADDLQGINQFNMTVSQGINGLGSTDNGNALASRAAGRVDFTKVEGTISRTQPLPTRFSIFAALYGQYAGTSLLSSEQCGYGGRFFGRAFDPSEILGDSCWQAIGELRYNPPISLPQVNFVQLYAFTDYGKVYTREPAVGTAASAHGASAGGGLRFAAFTNFNTDLQVVKAIGGERNDWRFFFAVTGSY